MEKALSTILRQTVALMAAGRTDAGVHARQMYAHLDLDASVDISNLKYKLNSFLPEDIAIQDIFEVPKDAPLRVSML